MSSTTQPAGQRRHGGKSDLNFNDFSELARQLRAIPILNGRYMTDIPVSGQTQIRIAHGLGRAYNGFIVLNTTLGVTEAGTNRSDIELVLDIESALTNKSDFKLKLWVF